MPPSYAGALSGNEPDSHFIIVGSLKFLWCLVIQPHDLLTSQNRTTSCGSLASWCNHEIHMTLRVSLTTKTVGGAGGPDMDEVPWTVPEVLQPAFGADDRVAAPVVGCEVALLVGGERPVVQLHLHHGQVFHVQVRIQPALLCRVFRHLEVGH